MRAYLEKIIKINIFSVVAVTLFISIFLMIGCAQNLNKKEEIVIGFSQCLADDWRTAMNEEIFTEASLVEDKNIKIEFRVANGNNKVQQKQIEELVALGVDVLMVSPNESEPLTQIISQVYQQGIPVVVIDRNIASDDYTVFIGADNHEVGKNAGKLALQKLENNPSPKILEITGSMRSSPAIHRQKGFRETVKANYEMIDANWLHKTAETKLDSLLTANPISYDLIYCHNDEMALAAHIITQKHRINPIILGVDGLSTPNGGLAMVLENQIDGTVLYPTGGDLAIEKAIEIVENKNVKKNYTLESFAIDQNNAYTLYYEGKRLNEQKSKLGKLIQQYNTLNYNLSNKNDLILMFSILSFLLFASIAFAIYFIFQKNEANKLLKNKQLVIDEQNKHIIEQRDHLLNAVRKMEEMSEIKSQFFMNISHDFKTLLTLIKLDIDNLPENTSQISHLRTNTNKLTKTLNRLLHHKEIRNSDKNLDFEYGNIAPLIEEVCNNFEPSATEKGLELKTELPIVNCDFNAEIIEKVLTNILHNAIKYTEKGQIFVQLYTLNNLVKISVEDSGIGVPEEEQKKIFERFEHSSISEFTEDSSGIGLNASMDWMMAHNGFIELNSRKGHGSNFIISFPKKQQNTSDLSIESTLEKAKTLKPKILLVEDNDQIRQRIASILHPTYNVVQATNGKEGYEQAIYHLPKLIVTDLLMPEMDGLEFCQKVFANPSTASTPVIILSAVDTQSSIVKGYRIGADDYITKPFGTEELLERINNLIKKRESAKSPIIPQNAIKTISESDQNFLLKIKEITFENIANPDFKIDDIVSELNMSRSKFYKKVKELTGDSPVKLLQKIKMEFAANLILKTDYTIAEVAYNSGFSDVKYFTKCFLKEFKIYPSEYKNQFQ